MDEEFLWNWFGMPDCSEEDQATYHYAISPYVSPEEYERDKKLLEDYNNASNPQTKFLMVVAAKVNRTECLTS